MGTLRFLKCKTCNAEWAHYQNMHVWYDNRSWSPNTIYLQYPTYSIHYRTSFSNTKQDRLSENVR